MGDTLNAVLKLCNWWGLFKNYILLLILLIIIIVIGVIHSKINKTTGRVIKIAYCTHTEEVVRRRSEERTGAGTRPGSSAQPSKIRKKYTCWLIVGFTLNGENHVGVIKQGAKTNYKVGDNINIDYKHVTPTQNFYADIVDGLRSFCQDYGERLAGADPAMDMCSESRFNSDIAPSLSPEGATADGFIARPDPEDIDTYIKEYIKLIPVYTRFCGLPAFSNHGDWNDMLREQRRLCESGSPSERRQCLADRDCIPDNVSGEIRDSKKYLIKLINKRLNDKGIQISLTWPRKLILIVCSIILIWTILWTYLRHFHSDKSFMKFFIGLTCWQSFTSSIRGD